MKKSKVILKVTSLNFRKKNKIYTKSSSAFFFLIISFCVYTHITNLSIEKEKKKEKKRERELFFSIFHVF